MDCRNFIYLVLSIIHSTYSVPAGFLEPRNPNNVAGRWGIGGGINLSLGDKSIGFGAGTGTNGGGGGSGPWGAAGVGGTSNAYAPDVRIPPGPQWKDEKWRENLFRPLAEIEGGRLPEETEGENTGREEMERRPVEEYREPIEGLRQRAEEYQEPMAGLRQSAEEYREPMEGPRQHAEEYVEPSNELRQSALQNELFQVRPIKVGEDFEEFQNDLNG